jgi:hypothetical protein
MFGLRRKSMSELTDPGTTRKNEEVAAGRE